MIVFLNVISLGYNILSSLAYTLTLEIPISIYVQQVLVQSEQY